MIRLVLLSWLVSEVTLVGHAFPDDGIFLPCCQSFLSLSAVAFQILIEVKSATVKAQMCLVSTA